MNKKKTLLLFLIIALAAFFRFTGINWDQNAHLHPDERFLTMVATSITWPSSISEYFDTSLSPANPHNKGFSFYVYGTYPLYLTKAVAQFVRMDTYEGITLVGRFLSGIMDLFTLLFVFLITRLLVSRDNEETKRGSLAPYLAAFLYAVMVLPIQLSHFFTVDPYAILFLTVALFRLLKGRIDAPLGIAVGLAIGAKISSVLILPIIAIAFLITWPWKASRNDFWNNAWNHVRSGALFGMACVATIRIVYPYLFQGWALNPAVLTNWKELKAFDGPLTTFPPALQWIGVPFTQPLLDMIVWGLGIPLGLIAFASIVFFGLRITTIGLRKRAQKSDALYGIGILFLWIVLVVAYQSLQFAKAMRYLYPIYPALAVLIAQFLAKLSSHSFIRLFVYSLIGLFMIWPLAFVSIYTRPHTRVAASDWIYTNIPIGKIIAWEHWDDPLPLARGTNNITLYQTIQLAMYDPDSETKWKKLTQELAQADFLLLSSNRVYGGTLHAKNRYPFTNRYYDLLFSGALGFEKVAEFTSRPGIFVDDNAEESFTVYDHPKVTIFTNKARLTADQLYEHIIR